MSKLRLYIIPLLAFGLLCCKVEAQHSHDVLEASRKPKPPYVAALADKTAWDVKIVNLGDIARRKEAENVLKARPNADPVAVEREVATSIPEPGTTSQHVRLVSNGFSRAIRRERIHTRSGQTFTNYIVGRKLLYEDPKTKAPRIRRTPELFLDEPSSYGRVGEFLAGYSVDAGKLGEFAWVDSKNYSGNITRNGQLCHVYRLTEFDSTHGYAAQPAAPSFDETGAPVPPPPPPSERELRKMKQQVVQTAFINAETKLPVALETPYSIREYEFRPLEEPVILPTAFIELLKRQEADRVKYYKRFAIPQ